MRCPNCNQEVDSFSSFCPSCGQTLNTEKSVDPWLEASAANKHSSNTNGYSGGNNNTARSANNCSNFQPNNNYPCVPTVNTSSTQKGPTEIQKDHDSTMYAILSWVFSFVFPIVGLVLACQGIPKALAADNKWSYGACKAAKVMSIVMLVLEVIGVIVSIAVISTVVSNMEYYYNGCISLLSTR